MKLRFKIGSHAWLARTSSRVVDDLCPVCFGKLKVVVILGDDTQVELACEFCAKGYGAPRGIVQDRRMEVADPQLVEITGVSIENNSKVEYRSGCAIIGESLLFADRAEALRRSEELVVEQQAEHDKRRDAVKQYDLKSYSWHVGYWRREARDCHERALRAEAKAKVCAEKAEKKVTP